jgi:hypothetical protein
VACPAGKSAIGGGFWPSNSVVITGSHPNVVTPNHADAWIVDVRNDSASLQSVRAWAICASATS